MRIRDYKKEYQRRRNRREQRSLGWEWRMDLPWDERMTTIGESRGNGFPEFQGNYRVQALRGIDYLDELSAEYNQDIEHWQIQAFYWFYPDGISLPENKRDIYHRFQEKRALEAPTEKPGKRVLGKFFKEELARAKARFDEESDVENDLRQSLSRAQAHFTNAENELSFAVQCRLVLNGEAPKTQELEAHIEKILSGNFYRFHSWNEVEKTLYFVTQDIHVKEMNKKAGIEIHCNLGQMRVGIRIGNLALLVRGHSKNTILGNKIHPCIVTDNTAGICWGNAKAQAEDFRLKRDVSGLFQLLEALLMSPGVKPYVPLIEFYNAIKKKRDAQMTKALAIEGKTPIESDADKLDREAMERANRVIAMAQTEGAQWQGGPANRVQTATEELFQQRSHQLIGINESILSPAQPFDTTFDANPLEPA